ncbi:protein of unknown function [Candidatus Filomicrobium marinum]|uniref:Uncharacterized protein n=1 Tax=Candidatus Filomicrobium marinum TaxID=1608628 RepID=A0A0D6JEV7_9HYPH|nr:protein of unknown function [Candidatus Filomicrobium marinum]CPR18214.1 protein of unknown function [Candidatus Filomicrobium marinum]
MGRTERARVEAIAAADAQVLVMQNDAFVGLVEAVDGADGHARCIRAVHARDRNRPLTRFAVVDCDDTPTVYAPRHLMLVFTGGDASVALNAAFGVAEKLHTCHGSGPPDLAERGL